MHDIAPGTNDGSIKSIVNLNGTLLFAANDGTNGDELWKSDGTAAGTTLVKNIRGKCITRRVDVVGAEVASSFLWDERRRALEQPTAAMAVRS